MTDKKTFGNFIKAKRLEKNFSQKDLADRLFISEGAVSKWERGVSYPDITLISRICQLLDISEHELITASTDTDAQNQRADAKKFRVISGVWFWVPTIAYIIALIPCFICNLAINHTLSWFFIVLAALLCAYSFIPTFTSFFKKRKLQVFILTSYTSICILLFTCALYTKTLFWVPVACIGVLLGYTLIFLPILLSSRGKFVITLAVALVLTIILLLFVNTFAPIKVFSAMAITCYAYMPVILSAAVCLLRMNPFLKTSFCIFIMSAGYCFAGYVVNLLFDLSENHYEINFNNWAECVSGNVHFITITSLILIGLVFLCIGLIKNRKNT